ncbi:hypothetical protein B0H16DRAFT_1737644 [Mycena metata]|uniref:Carbohydrate-binding module family 19 domain-containing protein n=1 Tax=Mycena metata TaxID=1033252 RepID=A0AAD7HK56_9AGAR|nr:hypothetical protein B0H16DRAFT_1737644 [Mycena metata]
MVRFLAFLALSTLLALASAIPTEDDSYGGKCDYEGELKCVGKKFATCDHGYFVIRDCAPGTVCRPQGKSIVCDFPSHKY